ncbi:MAG: NAD(+)/NADH kinase, partial [Gemmatimonadetes bacterium]|nr:NAD(+)/NADH kinase [Gemmatimonadota bacterium]
MIYHGSLPEAEALARALCERYGPDGSWWAATDRMLLASGSPRAGTELIVTIGGDGTILRGVHVAGPLGIPVLGVNMGRVGFMSEMDAEEAPEGVAWYVEGNARVERRTMLEVEVLSAEGGGLEGPVDALNDAVVRRGEGIVDVATVLDGVELATYRGDGVVVATATGSTGYCLSLGGPVMEPLSDSILLKPIAAHMSMFGGVMVSPDSVLELTVEAGRGATLSVDGFLHWAVAEGQTVRVRRS